MFYEAGYLGIRENVRLYRWLGFRELSGVRDKASRDTTPTVEAEVSDDVHAMQLGIGTD